MTRLPKEKKMLQYCIRVKGVLDSKWTDWFSGLTMTAIDSGETQLLGYLPDQAALHGILAKIRDLGLTLLLVQLIERPAKNSCRVEEIKD